MKKFVKLMPDYLSTGVWNEHGINIDLDMIPIPYWLKVMVADWQAEYDRLAYDEKEFDVKKFSIEGLAIAKKIKRELPRWTVIYFDESRASTFVRPSNYEYEVI
jgi:hypothetical protein